jgi:hypothetical protein
MSKQHMLNGTMFTWMEKTGGGRGSVKSFKGIVNHLIATSDSLNYTLHCLVNIL